MNHKVVSFIVALLLALVVYAIWPTEHSSEDAAGNELALGSGTASPLPSASGDHARTKSPGRAPVTREQKEPTHSVAQLKGFYLNDLSSEGCTLEAALNLALDEYYRICTTTGESPQPIKFDIEGTPEGPIHFKLNNVPFWQAVNHLCALAGMKMETQGATSRVVAVEESSGLITRTWAVPPNFKSKLAQSDSNDPFGTPVVVGEIYSLLQERGILKDEEASATLIPSTSSLIVRGGTRDMHRTDTLYDLEVVAPVMVQSTTKVVDVPNGAEVPVGSYSDEETQQILQDLLQQEGAVVIGSPTIVARPGQAANVVLGGLIQDDGEIIHGRQINLSGHLTGFQLGGTIGSSQIMTSEGSTTSSHELTSSFTVEPGDWMILSTGPQENGTTEYIFTQSNTVDAAGQVVTTRPTDTPIESPVDPIPLDLPAVPSLPSP